VHDKGNSYSWSMALNDENGTVFTGFLATLNSGGGFGGSNGWRLPTIAELQTTVMDFPCTRSICSCPTFLCADPALGPTQQNWYWSATTDVAVPSRAWFVDFADGVPSADEKGNLDSVRAVRGGL
jgi:hypothetical protein